MASMRGAGGRCVLFWFWAAWAVPLAACRLSPSPSPNRLLDTRARGPPGVPVCCLCRNRGLYNNRGKPPTGDPGDWGLGYLL
eukprot:scaffold18968_cov114-Isochrysis_galbana.AAC.6